jgi:hypothetical protein
MTVPYGAIQINDLVEKVVEAKYGPGAVASPTFEDGEETSIDEKMFVEGERKTFKQRRKYVTREGVKITLEEDTARRDTAAECIEGALLNSDITAFTKIVGNQYNSSGDRVDFLPSDWNPDTLMLALFEGAFAGPVDGVATDVPVLVEDSLAEKWIKSVSEQETKLPVKSNNSDKPKRKSNAGVKPGKYYNRLVRYLELVKVNPDKGEDFLVSATPTELRKMVGHYFYKEDPDSKLKYPTSRSAQDAAINKGLQDIGVER